MPKDSFLLWNGLDAKGNKSPATNNHGRETLQQFWQRSLSTGCQERLVHELLFGEAQPPLGWLPIRGVEDTFTHSQASLLPQLLEVLLHQLWDGNIIR